MSNSGGGAAQRKGQGSAPSVPHPLALVLDSQIAAKRGGSSHLVSTQEEETGEVADPTRSVDPATPTKRVVRHLPPAKQSPQMSTQSGGKKGQSNLAANSEVDDARGARRGEALATGDLVHLRKAMVSQVTSRHEQKAGVANQAAAAGGVGGNADSFSWPARR
jgi:hypothetical protein